ncbi:LamG-like jellyroll fold domain-containing protein [Actinoplanes sp. NPDC049265]|uniref:LamG-like jellyroll fold domain-containing protein n=1 Tax=Actinoplanes sp. NPDC049265 TaxID=3363902 RepID=UPI0037106EF2
MSHSRRLAGPIAAVLVFGAGVIGAVHLTRAEAMPARDPAPEQVRLPPPAAGVITSSGSPSEREQPGRIAVAARPVSVRYTFDGGVDKPIVDAQGGHELRAVGQNGGLLSLVPQGPGLAVEYPDRCTMPRERDCPRAILEGRRDDALNPGTRSLEYGASVLMTHADLADGANVVQKGYSVGGVSQFKLQVDHRQGHPSCVIASRARIYRAEPPLDVADGAWHQLTCTRTKDRLALVVDGSERAAVPVPANLSIANAEPLRIGGKGANRGNDQFAGLIDNVFLTIA